MSVGEYQTVMINDEKVMSISYRSAKNDIAKPTRPNND